MRTRTIAATIVIAAATAAVAGVLGAGSAAAAVPVTNPKSGGIGVEFNHGETQALANGPIPALIEQVVPSSAISVSIRPDSQLHANGGHVYADMPDVIGEAAGRPNGKVAMVLDPGPGLVVVQDW